MPSLSRATRRARERTSPHQWGAMPAALVSQLELILAERQPKVDSGGCDEGITEARKNSPDHETGGAVRDLKRWWNERDEGGT